MSDVASIDTAALLVVLNDRSDGLRMLLTHIPPRTMDRIIDRLDDEQCVLLSRVFEGYKPENDLLKRVALAEVP